MLCHLCRDRSGHSNGCQYQLTRISKNKGALAHEDRLEALAMGVNYWVKAMAQDADTQLCTHKEEMLQQELERFMEHAIGSPVRQRNRWVQA